MSTSDLGRHCSIHCATLQGPSQARHVPRVRISAFVDGSNNKYSVFVDDWPLLAKRGEYDSADVHRMDGV